MPSSSRELNEGVRRFSLGCEQTGASTIDSSTVPGAAGSQNPGGGYVDLDDLFGAASAAWATSSRRSFGGAARGGRAVRKEGRDMGIGLRLTLEEVARGVKKEIVRPPRAVS